ncbi:MAG: hypothetical protein UX35_C0010G0088 [Microgenomates group bacterium GW2011_GWA1_46_15]|nr:MAG: hypothetical protein UX35_C0010G0088 [Microgenomates group bacterium GW2011_GWA1_46_15]
MITPVKKAILQTLCYADVFDCALSRDEVWRFLMSSKKMKRAEFDEALRSLRGVQKQGTFVCLPGRTTLFSLRTARAKETAKKMREIPNLLVMVRWIPTISALFVTGGVAVKNAKEEDDIDVMVVTQQGWLWTTRAIVILVSLLVGKYRSRRLRDTSNRWCFNLWLDETALTIPSIYRNLYTAHEVVQAKPVFDRRNITQRFLAENGWVKTFLANGADWERVECGAQIPLKKIFTTNPIEALLYALQQRHMRHTRTRERIGQSFAFFHPRDTKGIVMKKFKERIKTYAA